MNATYYQKIEEKQDCTEISVFADCMRSSHLTVLQFKDEAQLPTGGIHIDDCILQPETKQTATKTASFDEDFRQINYQAYQSRVNEYSAFRHRYNNYHNGL